MRRREFIQTASILAAGSALHGRAHAERAPLSAAVIGTGTRGQYLVRLFNPGDLPTFRLAAVCDDYPPHLEWAQKRAKLPDQDATDDYRRVLDRKDIDAVVIATPTYLHRQMTLDALSAGKHVFVEKNLARTPAECMDIARAFKASGRSLQVGFQRHFGTAYQKAVKGLRDGRYGDILRVHTTWNRRDSWRKPVPRPALERKLNWKLYRAYAAGLFSELCSHFTELVTWIMGAPPVSVSGSGSLLHWKDGRECFDNVSTVYTYENGVQHICDILIANAHFGLAERVITKDSVIVLNDARRFESPPPPAPGILQLIHSLERRLFETIPIGGASWIPEKPVEDGGEYILDDPKKQPDATKLALQHFGDCIIRDTPDWDLFESAYRGSIACLMAEEACLEGKVVRWKPEYELASATTDR